MCSNSRWSEVGLSTFNYVVTDLSRSMFWWLERIDTIKGLGDVTIIQSGSAAFLDSKPSLCAVITINEKDCNTQFDRTSKVLIAAWKWADNRAPKVLKNKISEYHVTKLAGTKYDRELQAWLVYGWLVSYCEEEFRPPQVLILLMAVVQENKNKVRPVLDYRKLNQRVDAFMDFMTSAEVCPYKLREWRQKGDNLFENLSTSAHPQIPVTFSDCASEQRHCLTWLGFGLNVVPLIMRSIFDSVISSWLN